MINGFAVFPNILRQAPGAALSSYHIQHDAQLCLLSLTFVVTV